MKLTTFSDFTLRVLMFLALNRDRLGQIVRVSEGNAPIVECLSADADTCRIAPACRLAGILVRAFDALYAALDEYTLADLVQSPRGLTTLLARA
jgi:Rrf2 family nitric oxide-sensitive transcriptional repressor